MPDFDSLARQLERLLNEQGAMRDDMSVVMARLDRIDATTRSAVDEVRALHRQIARLASP